MTIAFSKHACLRIHERFKSQSTDLYLKLESSLLKPHLFERENRFSVFDSVDGCKFKVVFVETAPMSFKVITVIRFQNSQIRDGNLDFTTFVHRMLRKVYHVTIPEFCTIKFSILTPRGDAPMRIVVSIDMFPPKIFFNFRNAVNLGDSKSFIARN